MAVLPDFFLERFQLLRQRNGLGQMLLEVFLTLEFMQEFQQLVFLLLGKAGMMGDVVTDKFRNPARRE